MTPSWQMSQCNPICCFFIHTISPPTVLAITSGVIFIAPKLDKYFPISLTVAPLSKMSSISKMLFPLISLGSVYKKAPLTLSVFKYLFSKIFCSLVSRILLRLCEIGIFRTCDTFNAKFLTRSPDFVGGT